MGAYEGNGRGQEVVYSAEQLYEEAVRTGLDMGKKKVGTAVVQLALHLIIADLGAIDPLKGSRGQVMGLPWAQRYVRQIRGMMHLKGKGSKNYNHLENALFGVKKLEKFAADDSKYKHLKLSELAKAKQEFIEHMGKYILKSDFGDTIEFRAEEIFEEAYAVDLDVSDVAVQGVLYTCAVFLSSVRYETQLGQSQNSYGTLDSTTFRK